MFSAITLFSQQNFSRTNHGEITTSELLLLLKKNKVPVVYGTTLNMSRKKTRTHLNNLKTANIMYFLRSIRI